MKWLKIPLYTLLLTAVLAAVTAAVLLYRSVPTYDGVSPAGVSAKVQLSRDAQGYLTVRATNRLDAAFGLGYAHAQDRFFQMDLLRRNAAG